MPNTVYDLPLMVREGQMETVSLSTGFSTVKIFSSREGTVELVRSRRTGKLRIIKSVRHNDRRKPPHEAYILSRQGRQHDNIIRLYAAELTSTGRGLMCFEYCNGGDLFEQCRKFDSLGIPTPTLFALHIWVSLADALAFLHHGLMHDQGSVYRKICHGETMLHSDIKEDNIYLRFPSAARGVSNSAGGSSHRFARWAAGASHEVWGVNGNMPEVVLADFGMSVPLGDFRGGCKPYLPPECRYSNSPNPTNKADIYSLGVTMKCILDRESDIWPIFTDPKEAAIHIEYKGLGMTNVLRSMLAIDPAGRGDFSGTRGRGLLKEISKFRKQRDEMIDLGVEIDPSLWNIK